MKLKTDTDFLGISVDTLMLLFNSTKVPLHNIAGFTAN